MRGKGRHDPCVLPRAAPMVEVCFALSRSESTCTVEMSPFGASTLLTPTTLITSEEFRRGIENLTGFKCSSCWSS